MKDLTLSPYIFCFPFLFINDQNVRIGTSTPLGALERISSDGRALIASVALTNTIDVTTIPDRTISESTYNYLATESRPTKSKI